MKKLLFLFLLIATPAQAQWVVTFNEGTAGEAELPFMLFDATDGETEEPGLTISGADCTISENGGAFGNCAGTVTGVGNGLYVYAPTAAELDTRGHYVIRVVESGTTDVTYVAYQVRPGLESADFSADQLTSESTVTIGLKTGGILADDQYNGGLLVVLDNATFQPKAWVSICDSANTGDLLTTCADISGSIVGAGGSADYYFIVAPALIKDGTLTGEIDTAGGHVRVVDGSMTAAKFASIAETTSVPSTGSVDPLTMIRVLYQAVVHKFESTSSEQVNYQSDGSTKWFEKDISDNGTTFSKDAAETAD